MKRIVLFVEGEADAGAVPKLVKRLLTELHAWDAVFLDENPFRVGQVNKLVKNEYHGWKRLLRAALKRPKVGGVLLILDGDVRIGTDPFCAADVAKALVNEATDVGAGVTFSVAVVFARQEYESWLIGGIERLAEKAPAGNLEENPRDAKGWLNRTIEGGYRPTRDQATLTNSLDLDVVRNRELRSFRRLETALMELVSANRNDQPVATPSRR